MKLLRIFAILFLSVFSSTLFAQDQTGRELPDRLPAEWVLKYEQLYGVRGLYADEPHAPEQDTAAKVRRDLIALTRASREFLKSFPDETPTPKRLLAMGFLEEEIVSPEGIEYTYSPDVNRFVSSIGGAYDIVTGALLQLKAAEEYRRRIVNPSQFVWQNWNRLKQMPDLPELLQREIETRQYALRVLESGPIQAARQTQEQLQTLNDAIEMATALGQLEVGQEIEMQDVGRTGLIDLLPALPLNGKYKVTKVGEPPVAVFGEVEVPFDPYSIQKRIKESALQAYEKQQDYPPAMALAARYTEGEAGLQLIDEAVDAWPDVPALRVQRLSMNAEMFNTLAADPAVGNARLRVHLDAISEDTDYLLARFPSAPILLEIDMAIGKGYLAEDMEFRSVIARSAAAVRPEILNIQVMALKYLIEAGKIIEAQEIYDDLTARHPGYAPLLLNPSGDLIAP